MAILKTEEYEKIIEELGVSKKTADMAIALSVEIAMRRYFNAYDCLVDMELKTANIVFIMPRHENHIERFDLTKYVLVHDIMPVTFKLHELPQPVKSMATFLFLDILRQMKIEDDYAIWIKQAHQIIDGVILEKRADYLTVDLKGAVGQVEKCDWVESEEGLYRAGNILFFLVKKVESTSQGVSISLSRSSVRLPALIFKFYLPMHQFFCVSRNIGQKSVILTDAPVRDQDIIRVRKKVSQELNNEIMEMRNFDQMEQK